MKKMGDLPGLFFHPYINVNSGAQLLPCPCLSPTCQCLLWGVKVTSRLREVRAKMTLWDGSLTSGEDSWKWQQQLAISGSHFLYPLPPSPPPLSLPHALNPVSGPLVLGEGGREAGCCARLAAVTEELFIVEFWWFKSYGIAWNHCRNLEALQTAGTRAPSLSFSVSCLPPSLPHTLPCYNLFQTFFLFSFPLSLASHIFCPLLTTNSLSLFWLFPSFVSPSFLSTHTQWSEVVTWPCVDGSWSLPADVSEIMVWKFR